MDHLLFTSKILSKILSNETEKMSVSRKIVCFGISIHICREDNKNTIVYVFNTVIIDNSYLAL